MVLALPLADVVEENGKDKQFGLADISSNARIQGLRIFVDAGPELFNFLDGKKRMDINRIDVIGVVLHLAVDALEFRDILVQKS